MERRAEEKNQDGEISLFKGGAQVNKLEVKDNRFYLDGSELTFLTEITIDKLSAETARVSLSMVAKTTGEIELPIGLHWTLSARAKE